MSGIDIRAINLNLLPALEALLVEGSVSAAARRTHVTQSAMSHSLAKLRELFDDPLFITSGRRMVPTPMAERLAAELSVALDQLGTAIAVPPPFSPRTSKRVFRIATLDYFELTALPDLLGYLAKHAPFVDIEIDRFSPTILPSLVSGEIDLALIGETAEVPLAGLHRKVLYADPFAVLVRPGHPQVKKTLDLETYLSLGHVLVSVEGRRLGAVDRVLAKMGRTRRVALRVPHFVSAPLAVLRSDHVCTIASGVAFRARELFGLRVLPAPIDVAPAGVVALWSRRKDSDDGARWFRDLFLSGRGLSAHARTLFQGRDTAVGP